MITDDGFLQTHIAIFFAFKLLSLKSFEAQYSTKVSELGLLSQISQFYHSPQAPSGDGCTGFLSHTEIDCPQLSEHRPTPRLAGAVHSRSLRLWRLRSRREWCVSRTCSVALGLCSLDVKGEQLHLAAIKAVQMRLQSCLADQLVKRDYAEYCRFPHA